MNTILAQLKILGGGYVLHGTFRFKKLDDSFWNGETFRFADYIRSYIMIINERNNIAKYSITCMFHKHFENIVPFF